MLGHSINRALNCRLVNQRAHGIVDQHNILFRGGQCSQGMRHRLLAAVAALDNVDAPRETVLGHLGFNALHLRFTHRNVDRLDALDRGKGAQRMDENRDPIERKKLLRLRAGHSCAQSRGGKNCKYLHNSWSIQRHSARRII